MFSASVDGGIMFGGKSDDEDLAECLHNDFVDGENGGMPPELAWDGVTLSSGLWRWQDNVGSVL